MEGSLGGTTPSPKIDFSFVKIRFLVVGVVPPNENVPEGLVRTGCKSTVQANPLYKDLFIACILMRLNKGSLYFHGF